MIEALRNAAIQREPYACSIENTRMEATAKAARVGDDFACENGHATAAFAD